MANNPYRQPDFRTRQAKAQGYPARSIFKLEEIDKRVGLLRPGQHVLDLGAAPGSWAMYVSQRIGRQGRLLAMDISPITQTFAPNVTVIQGDALSLANQDLATFAPYQVVLSDMAPATCGNREADQARSAELFLRALEVAAALLVPGGSFVGKLFMGESFTEVRDRTRQVFDEVKVIRPEGTRTRSVEVFLVGMKRKAELGPK